MNHITHWKRTWYKIRGDSDHIRGYLLQEIKGIIFADPEWCWYICISRNTNMEIRMLRLNIIWVRKHYRYYFWQGRKISLKNHAWYNISKMNSMPTVSILINDTPLTESYKDMAAWDPIYWQRFTGNKTQMNNHNREFLWDVITHGLKSTAVWLNCH